MFKHFLIPTDGSHVANKAAKAGIALLGRLHYTDKDRYAGAMKTSVIISLQANPYRST